MGKKYEVSLTPVSVGPIPGINSGITVATYLTRNSAFVFGYSVLSVGRKCWGSLSCSDSGQTFEAYYRQFFGNSFYVAGGVDQRHVSVSGSDSSSSEEFSFDGDTTAINVVVGNQWHWENFVLGCDWFGLSVPVSTSLSNVKTTTNDYDFQEAKSYYVTGRTAISLRLHVGMTF